MKEYLETSFEQRDPSPEELSMMARLETPHTRMLDAIMDAQPSKATRAKARLKRKKRK